ncbi:MAG: hypothetical protein GYB32_04415 [Algicola sp.]|nr:hypothetical protein [Algicola sp.]
MPKILITGNGFDLSYGLPTAYHDFINILNKIENNNNTVSFEALYSSINSYDKICRTYYDFEINLEKIELLKDAIKKNNWYKFFSDEFNIETWIDFENKIEFVVKTIFNSMEDIQNKIFSNGSVPTDDLYYGRDLFNNNIESIQVLTKFNLISLDETRDNLNLNKEFIVRKYGYYIKVDIDKVTKYLYSELYDFKKIFNYYFETFVFPLYDNLKIELFPFIYKSVDRHYTFNYTPTFERFTRAKKITSYIHGKVNSKTNQIVLGIDEVPSDSKYRKNFLPFTKYFQKLDNKTDYLFIKEFEKEQNSNYMFFFLGHSLDKSDKDYINEVFDFVNNLNASIKNIIVLYHTEGAKSQLLLNLLDIRGKEDIQELMKTKILKFIPINSNQFEILLNTDLTNSSNNISVF